MKKGFTLIEVVVAGALFGILITFQMVSLSRYMKAYKISIIESRESFNAAEAFAFIEYVIDQAVYAEAVNGVIELKRRDGTGSDWIVLGSDGDLVISYGSCFSGNSNNIMKGIKAFEVEQRGMMLFISIVTLKENEFKGCIMLNTKRIAALF
ncbi:MAG: type II secretion system protein [Clostridiaceae bacterium]